MFEINGPRQKRLRAMGVAWVLLLVAVRFFDRAGGFLGWMSNRQADLVARMGWGLLLVGGVAWVVMWIVSVRQDVADHDEAVRKGPRPGRKDES